MSSEDRFCDFHTKWQSPQHPDTEKRNVALIAAAAIDDPADRLIQWEKVFNDFIDCDVCVREQLDLLTLKAAWR